MKRDGQPPRSWARVFGDALRGVVAVVISQRNAKVHAAATVTVIALAIWLEVDRTGWTLLVLATGLVWMAELFNTALEWLADAAHPQPHPLVGRAKDAAAGAVLIATLAAVVIGLLVLGPALWAWLA